MSLGVVGELAPCGESVFEEEPGYPVAAVGQDHISAHFLCFALDPAQKIRADALPAAVLIHPDAVDFGGVVPVDSGYDGGDQVPVLVSKLLAERDIAVSVRHDLNTKLIEPPADDLGVFPAAGRHLIPLCCGVVFRDAVRDIFLEPLG